MAVFVAVVDSGGFSQAARKLGLTKSTVSRLISDLERETGVSLLSRSTRSMAPTAAGQVYYEGAARMVAEADHAAQSLSGYDAEPTGLLRISAPHGLAPHVLAVLGDMARDFGQLRFDIRLESRYVNLIEEDIDVAVRAGLIEDSALIMRTLASIGYVVAASPAYLERYGIPMSVADLAHHEWISYERGPVQLTGRKSGRVSRVAVRGRWKANDRASILGLLLAGQGITLTPLWEVSDELDRGDLRVVLADYEFKTATIGLLSPDGKHKLPKITEFSKRMVRRFRDIDWTRIDPRWIAPADGRDVQLERSSPREARD